MPGTIRKRGNFCCLKKEINSCRLKILAAPRHCHTIAAGLVYLYHGTARGWIALRKLPEGVIHFYCLCAVCSYACISFVVFFVPCLFLKFKLPLCCFFSHRQARLLQHMRPLRKLLGSLQLSTAVEGG